MSLCWRGISYDELQTKLTRIWSPGPKFSLQNTVHLLKNWSGLKTLVLGLLSQTGDSKSTKGKQPFETINVPGEDYCTGMSIPEETGCAIVLIKTQLLLFTEVSNSSNLFCLPNYFSRLSNTIHTLWYWLVLLNCSHRSICAWTITPSADQKIVDDPSIKHFVLKIVLMCVICNTLSTDKFSKNFGPLNQNVCDTTEP